MKGVKRVGFWLAIVLAVGTLAGAGYVYTAGRGTVARFRTAKVDRGPIAATVSTTGTVNAVTTVQVGSQVSGQISELMVDFNSPVKKNQLIARLDPAIFQAKVNAARAELEGAQSAVLNQRANVEKTRAEVDNARASAATADANVVRMRADIENARAAVATAQANVARDGATLINAKRELDRRVDLLRRELIAQSEKDQAQTTFDTAAAQLEAARAQERAGHAALRSAEAQLQAVQSQAVAAQTQIASARASLQVAEAQQKTAEATVRQKQAALDQAKVDLEHTEIRAPVNGVVVSRTIDVGQTVAASLQAPTLFTIAEDLTRMQVEAAVDEADIGRLVEGMPGSFTIDAFPGRGFRGDITQIRKAPLVVQNVVTYTVVLAVANPERLLMPGMTANVRIEVDRRPEALRVPNAALRFRPPSDTPGEGPRGGATDGARGGAGRAGGGSAAGSGAGTDAASTPRGGGGRGGGGLTELRETLIRDLGLTEAQQTQLDAVLAEARQTLAGLRGQDQDEAARARQRQRVREEIRAKVRAFLTPEQQRRYDAQATGGTAASGGPTARPAAPVTSARVFILGPDGKPKAVPISVGISDGQSSEVVQGELQPGQEVLVGLTPGSGTRSGGQSGPRLRL